MKQQIIVISDMWGKKHWGWLDLYRNALEEKFDVQYYDACTIAMIDTETYNEENLHAQFVNGGIDNAVNFLLNNIKQTSQVLAFSVGGTIAWKAALLGMPVEQLYLVSASRLRYETKRPNVPIHTFYGAKDVYKPKPIWFKALDVANYEFVDFGHQLYKHSNCAIKIIDYIVGNSYNDIC